MIIRIKTDCGFYETEIQESLELEELSALIEKLKEIQRFLEPQKKYNTNKERIPYGSGIKNILKSYDTREKAVEALRKYYFGTDEDRQAIKGIGFDLRRKYGIQAYEVGLKRFPGKGEFGGKAGQNVLDFAKLNKL